MTGHVLEKARGSVDLEGFPLTVSDVVILGMPMIRWTWQSCTAEFAVNTRDMWCTLSYIESKEKNQGHATMLLSIAKASYEEAGYIFGGSVALSQAMSYLYKKLGIKEYNNDAELKEKE